MVFFLHHILDSWAAFPHCAISLSVKWEHFQIQIKVLEMAYKARHSLGLEYLRDCLTLISSTHPLNPAEKKHVVDQHVPNGTQEKSFFYHSPVPSEHPLP